MLTLAPIGNQKGLLWAAATTATAATTAAAQRSIAIVPTTIGERLEWSCNNRSPPHEGLRHPANTAYGARGGGGASRRLLVRVRVRLRLLLLLRRWWNLKRQLPLWRRAHGYQRAATAGTHCRMPP